MLSAKQGSHWYHFYNVFGMTRPGIDPTPILTYRTRSGRSTTWAIAAVSTPQAYSYQWIDPKLGSTCPEPKEFSYRGYLDNTWQFLQSLIVSIFHLQLINLQSESLYDWAPVPYLF